MGQQDRFHVNIMAVHPEVTGSCILVHIRYPNGENVKFFVDCGLFQEKELEEKNSQLFFNPSEVEFAFVTHNHVDHVGRVPCVVKKGFIGSIYTTEDTVKLMYPSLRDNFKVEKEMAKSKHRPMLYEEEHVERALSLLKPMEYNKTFEVMERIKVTFFGNGHIPGAAVILVQISYPSYEDINILFTGDYCPKNKFFDVFEIPDWVRELKLTIVQECTYGYMNSNEVQKVFRKNLVEHIGKGATVVIPVFALDRAQTLLYELKCMQDEGILGMQIPIYLDGKSAQLFTHMYSDGIVSIKEEMQDFLPKDVIPVDKVMRQDILKSTQSKIILTTSGMGTFGPAQLYIPEYIQRENALIHFTGYCAEGSLGYKLKHPNENGEVEINKNVFVKKRAKVEYTSEFSKHAKADELIEFLKQFKKLELVLLNHGETDVQYTFKERVMREVKTKAVEVLPGHFFRINPYGMVKKWPF